MGNAAEDFFGIKATSAVLQWPAHLGGKTTAGIADFRLGVNAAKQLRFRWGNGTIGLPEFENNLFKGAMTATVGKVNNSLVAVAASTEHAQY